MKKLCVFLLSLTWLLTACTKYTIEESTNTIVVPKEDKVLSTGSFVNGQHSVSGSVQLVQSATDQKKYLVLTNLKSDAGPALRVYLAEDNTAKVFTQVSDKVVNGDTKLEIPTTTNLDKQKTVLIWCQQFSVLFGYAELK